jgi:hypothetical protein
MQRANGFPSSQSGQHAQEMYHIISDHSIALAFRWPALAFDTRK